MTNSVRSTLRKSFLARDHPMNFFHGGAEIDKKRKGDSLQGDDKRRKTTRPGYFQGAQAMSGAFYRISRKRLVENVDVFLACQIDDGRCDFNTVYKKPRNFSEGKAEWRALSTLDHPNIVPLLDTVEAFRNEHVAFFYRTTGTRTFSSTGPKAARTRCRCPGFVKLQKRSRTRTPKGLRTATSKWRTCS